MNDRVFKIALVIKTRGLEYDDRVRKEILSVQRLYPNIKFKIFAMLPDNREVESVTEYGVPYKSVFIPAREKYPSNKRVYLKGWQFYKAIRKELEDYNAVWVADVEAFFVTALVKTNHLLWDLHELPYQMFGSKWKRMLLKYALNRCNIVVHANPQRAQYMKDIHLIDEMSNHFALRNYPNFEDVDTEYDESYWRFVEWKGNRKCVYLQGLSSKIRAASESVEAVLRKEGICAVVVGGFDSEIKRELKDKYKEDLERRVLFVGQIPQKKIPQYVQQCFMSLVFYTNVRPNNWFCEANRFYQAVVMGLPVVVGANPPMKEIVERYGFGVSIDDDGTHVDKILEGMDDVLDNYAIYKGNIAMNKNLLTWNSQDSVVREIVDRLIAPKPFH